MTPIEKAIELYQKFYKIQMIHNVTAKQCALIAVEEIIYNLSGLDDSVWYMNTNDYFKEVKNEINKL